MQANGFSWGGADCVVACFAVCGAACGLLTRQNCPLGSCHATRSPIHLFPPYSLPPPCPSPCYSPCACEPTRAVEVTRKGLLEGQEALDEDGNVIPVPRDTYGPKIEAAKGHEGLYHAIGRDFYLRLPLHSMANPGMVLHGTEFKLEKKALSIDFQTYTKNSATQWGQLDDELTAAWEVSVSATSTGAGGGYAVLVVLSLLDLMMLVLLSLVEPVVLVLVLWCGYHTPPRKSHYPLSYPLPFPNSSLTQSLSAAVLDLPTRATDSSLYQQRIRENILRISYYWFQLMPLSRGSAMVGLVSILGLSMAADMETTARIPRDVLVDWEGLFATRFQDFYDAAQ
ncbi:unnamed protein product [Closterium sp. NIES-53]